MTGIGGEDSGLVAHARLLCGWLARIVDLRGDGCCFRRPMRRPTPAPCPSPTGARPTPSSRRGRGAPRAPPAGGAPLALWATPRPPPRSRSSPALAPGVSVVPIDPARGCGGARAHPRGRRSRARCSAPPGHRDPRSRHVSPGRGPGARAGGASPSPGAVPDRVHERDDRALEGSRPLGGGDRRQPRRARRGLGVDGADVLVHALPLFHVHGLVLATLGRFASAARCATSAASTRSRSPRGSRARRRCSSPSRRCTAASPTRPRPIRSSLMACARARLLVSGSAALPAAEHARFDALTGSGSSSATG